MNAAISAISLFIAIWLTMSCTVNLINVVYHKLNKKFGWDFAKIAFFYAASLYFALQ